MSAASTTTCARRWTRCLLAASGCSIAAFCRCAVIIWSNRPPALRPLAGRKVRLRTRSNVVRERFFKPRLHFASFTEMNAWLLERCVTYAKGHPHPERRDSPVWEMFEAERPSLVRYVDPFDGFHARTASVSKTCLVQFDKNRYSVMAQAVGPPGGGARLRRAHRRAPGWRYYRHPRSLLRPASRSSTILGTNVPVLTRKPGASA